MMIEAWVAMAALACLAWFGLMGLANKCFDTARTIRLQKAQQRLRLRINMNLLLLSMVAEEDEDGLEMLRLAYVDSSTEYRRL